MLLQEHKNILLESPLFFSIDSNDYEELLEKFEYTLEYFEAGEEIAREFTNIGILLSGEVNISKESIDKSITVTEKVKIGEIFGEILACLNTKDSAYRIIANTTAEVILIPYNKLLNPTEYKHHFTLLSNLMRTLARRNLLVERKLEVLSKKTLSDKILAFLAIQREITGNNTFVVPYSRLELSEYLCVDRSALSRELSNLMKAGLIKYKKNLFTIMTSYEDINLDDFDDLDGINDLDEDYDELDLIETNIATIDTDITTENLNDLNELTDLDIDDIITIDGISIDDIDIDIDDSEIDAILSDGDILTENSIELEELDQILKEETQTKEIVEDDFFAQEYAKLDDIETDNISTVDVINEIMDDNVETTTVDTSFLQNVNFFADKLPSKSTGEYDDFDETEDEESAMDDEQQEEQARVFSQFVDQAKAIATKKLDQETVVSDQNFYNTEDSNENHTEVSLDNFADNLVEKLLHPTEDLARKVIEDVTEDLVENVAIEEQTNSKRDIPFEQYVQETIQEAIGEPLRQTPRQLELELELELEQHEQVPPELQVEPQVAVMPAGTQVKEVDVMEDFGEDFTEEFTQQQAPEQVHEEQQYDEYPEQVQQQYDEHPEQVQQQYDEYPEQVQQQYDEHPEQVQQQYDEYPEQVQQQYDEYPEQVQQEQYEEYQEYQEQVEQEQPVDDRDANLLLEPIDTLVDKISDELAPKSIEEAVEKLKDELLPLFARDPKDIAAEKLITKSPISDNIGVTEPKKVETTPTEEKLTEDSTSQEIAEDIVELFSKSKNKKQAKSRGFNLFNKFKRE